MAYQINDAPHVQGHLPLKADQLPPGMAPLSAGDVRVQQAAEILRNPAVIANPSSKPLFDAYAYSTNRLQDLMGDLQSKNNSMSDLREVKQQLRQLEGSEVDLNNHAAIKDKLALCVEQHGLIMTPGKTKFNKEELRALMDSINDCCDNHSDQGDIFRRKFKKASSDLDVLVRLISEWLSAEGSRAMAVVQNLRAH
jgi:predicted nucleotidyltransferase